MEQHERVPLEVSEAQLRAFGQAVAAAERDAERPTQHRTDAQTMRGGRVGQSPTSSSPRRSSASCSAVETSRNCNSTPG